MDSIEKSDFDFEAYRERIGYSGPLDDSAKTLFALHLAHGTRIPFENVDVLLGRPIRLDLPGLQEKLIVNKRGGYCFEQNTLFAAALETIGFRVTRLAARVRAGTDRILPRTHMLLEVTAEGLAYLVDVGFGAGGPLLPIRMTDGVVAEQFKWSYRLREQSGLWVLQGGQPDAWSDLYAFTREPQYPVDFEVANHFTSTHAGSIFVRTVTAQRQSTDERFTLRNRELVIEGISSQKKRTVTDPEDLRELLRTIFGLDFAPEIVRRVYGLSQPVQ